MAKAADPSKTRRELITPEGIPLVHHLAPTGDRAAAFFVDFIVMAAILALLAVLMSFADLSLVGGWGAAALSLIIFLLTNFYFMFFEVRWQGSTPGKRVIGIKVLDARGGRLTAEAIIARNLMRQVEIFVPLAVLVQADQFFPNASGLALFLCSLWLIILVFMPMFNRDNLRVGDMVAGTRVVTAPKVVLLPDIGASNSDGSQSALYKFTDKQLRVYGIYELQTLEKVLRHDGAVDRDVTIATVCDKIKRKIRWPQGEWHVDNERFLADFYVALRGHLEKSMLFGKRVTDKFSAQRGID